MKKSITNIVAVLAGIALIFTLFVRYGVMVFVLRTIISSKTKLAPGNDIWSIWSEMPIPIFTKFYFFNVTNPSQIQDGAKPILKEIGPFVYEEKRHKIILEHNDEIVKYRPKTTYIFRPDLSYGSQDDKVTLLNVPFVAVAKIAWDISKESFMLSTLDDLLAGKGETLFHTNKVREFLFDGVSIENYMELFSLPVEAFGMKAEIPERIMDGDFGFYDDRNGTAEEVWVVGSGVRNKDKFGKIFSFNGRTSLNAWDDPECDSLTDATDGTIFPPITSSSEILNIFHPDACRKLEMSYVGKGEFMEVPTMRYSFSKNVFESLDLHPENQCFCKETYEWCKKGGVFPIWPCVGGAPVFISRPHFKNSHADYKNAIIGLDDEGDYSSIVDVEPNVGLPIRAHVKLQVNLELQPFGSMATFVNVPNLMFPVIWAEQTAELSREWAWPLRAMTITFTYADHFTTFITLICSVIILCVVLVEKKALSSKWTAKDLCGVKFG